MARTGRPQVLKDATTLNLSLEKTTKDVLQDIADRETSGNVSELLRPTIEKYAKDHARGNNAFTLTEWTDQPEFMAMPTLGEILTPDRLKGVSDADLQDLEKAARGRKQEVDAELQRRHDKKWGKAGGLHPEIRGSKWD